MFVRGPAAGEGAIITGTPVSQDFGLRRGYYYELVDARMTLLDQDVERALGVVWGAGSLTAVPAVFTAQATGVRQVDLFGGTIGSRLPLVADTPIPLMLDRDLRLTASLRHADNIANGPLSAFVSARIVERADGDEW
jgi:hypothetical protein